MSTADRPLAPPREVLEIARRLEGAGYEAWCVGGAVRDALLGIQHLDWDLATSARPEEVRRIFRRTIPIGIEFGTVGVLDRNGTMHEVTTFRHDVETDGRHARVVFGASLEEDLARRDFTVNAIAYSPSRNVLFDPFGGRDDLRARLLRTVGDADQRMLEDRLRALRALRFAARFDFAISPETWAAIRKSVPFLHRLSAERVRQEVEKTMEQVEKPSRAFLLWRDAGALAALIPPLANATDIELTYSDFVRPPLPSSAASSARGRPERRTNRLTALFLPGEGGAKGSERLLRALRFSNSDIAWLSGQIERWISAGRKLESALLEGGAHAPQFRRRWISEAGRTRSLHLLRVCAAVWCARAAAGQEAPRFEDVRRFYRAVLRSMYRDPVELHDLAVDGDDLRAAGIPPGPALGRVLHVLLDRVLEDPGMNERAKLLEFARSLVDAPVPPSAPPIGEGA